MNYQDGRKAIPLTSPASNPLSMSLVYTPSCYSFMRSAVGRRSWSGRAQGRIKDFRRHARSLRARLSEAD